MNTSYKKSTLVLIYCILMIVAFTTRIGDFKISQNVQYGISFIIGFISFISFLVGSKYKFEKNQNLKKSLGFLLKNFFVPALLIHLYSLVMIILGFFSKDYLCSNISMYSPILLAVSSIYLFGDKALNYCCTSLILSWFISIIFSFCLKGFRILPYAILQGYFGSGSNLGITVNYFELHDLILSCGMILIYITLFANNKLKSNFMLILFVFIISLLGVKRIAALAFIMVYIMYRFLNKMSQKHKQKFYKIISYSVIIICYLFIFALMNENLVDFLNNKLHINLMGRNYYYSAISKYGNFSINYLGLGRSSVSTILTSTLSYLKVGGVHSDILKMYIENGFIVFGLWMIHYLVKIPKKLCKLNKYKTAFLYFCLIIYTFVLYFTDNVENYFIYQLFLCLITTTMFIKEGEIEKQNKK